MINRLKVCRDCNHIQSDTNDSFHGSRCLPCFKEYDNARGKLKRYFCRKETGAIKPSSEVSDTRECSGCREHKKTSEAFYFHTTKAGKTIPDRMCKQCKGEWLKSYRKTRKEKYAAYAKNWRDRNPEKHKLQKRSQRSSPIAKDKARRYSLQNAELTRARNRSFYRTERGRVYALCKRQRNRANKLKALTEKSYLVTDSWLVETFKSYEYKCAYCLEVCTPTMDHVIPVSRGGKHERENIVPACHPCNSSKCDKLVNEWKPWVVIPAYGFSLSTA